MPAPPSPRPLSSDEFDELIVREYGSYLHNVRPHVSGVCTICSTPVSGGFSLCLGCVRNTPPRDQLVNGSGVADRVGFMTYAVEGGQAYSVLRGYKNPALSHLYWAAAATWTTWFLGRHAHCAHRLVPDARPSWAWATVPSARSGRTGEHPLHMIVSQQRVAASRADCGEGRFRPWVRLVAGAGLGCSSRNLPLALWCLSLIHI